MGGGTYDPGKFRTYANSTRGKSTQQIFKNRQTHDGLNPHGVKIRESRDSTDNPNSTPMIVGLDVTGSMGMLADVLARKGLNTLLENVITRKPITDPHVMFAAIGDGYSDRAPLQVSQFEADLRICEQLAQIYLEGNGGGNGGEHYQLLWYFAAFHTEHDSFIKRGKRGYLFTVGDEPIHDELPLDVIEKVCGDTVEAKLTNRELLDLVSRKYDVYHVVIEEGGGSRMYGDRVRQTWTPLLGEKTIWLSDHTKLAEVIVSTMEIAEGVDHAQTVNGWDDDTAKVVSEAVKSLPKGNPPRQLGHTA